MKHNSPPPPSRPHWSIDKALQFGQLGPVNCQCRICGGRCYWCGRKTTCRPSHGQQRHNRLRKTRVPSVSFVKIILLWAVTIFFFLVLYGRTHFLTCTPHLARVPFLSLGRPMACAPRVLNAVVYLYSLSFGYVIYSSGSFVVRNVTLLLMVLLFSSCYTYIFIELCLFRFLSMYVSLIFLVLPTVENWKY